MYMYKILTPLPQNVTVFGDRVLGPGFDPSTGREGQREIRTQMHREDFVNMNMAIDKPRRDTSEDSTQGSRTMRQ
jgi:hypothetical protein